MSGVQKTAELIHAALVRAKEGSVTDLVGYPVGDGRIEFVTRKIEEVLLRYPSYMCQVIGFNDAGKKFIAFSFSPSEPDRARKNIDSQFIEVLDGGAGYWRIEFDVAEKRFVRFESNGDA